MRDNARQCTIAARYKSIIDFSIANKSHITLSLTSEML